MNHIPVSCEQREAMLRAVCASGVDDLFDSIPESVRLERPLAIAPGLPEMEVDARLRSLARANTPASDLVSFAGAGCYDHYIPSIVDHVVRKPEFFTAYTPYQPEVSQGTLQNIYEYQTMICELTGMDVANASMYDGATAFIEAAAMAARVTRRHRILMAGTTHPEWRVVAGTYADAGPLIVETLPVTDGVTAASSVTDAIADDVAAVAVTYPNFLGHLEDLRALAAIAHDAGALLIVAANPVMLGVLEAPAAFGADIVVGEGQPLGNPMSFGGPGLGFFACRETFLRQMPGRIVGRTVDADGAAAFVLTMQTREQHIRREKATSNICSNHALNALAAAVHLAALGPEGLAAAAHASIAKAHFLRDRLIASAAFDPVWDAPFANEFALRYRGGDVAVMRERMLEKGYLAGVDLGAIDPGMDGLVLFAVTERRTREEIESFVREVASL